MLPGLWFFTMGKVADARFNGRVGKYQFGVYTLDTDFKEIGAVYIFTKRTLDAARNSTHKCLYIGETDNLDKCIPNHEQWPCLNRNGVTHICVHVEQGVESRRVKKTDLRNANPTPCNDRIAP